MEKQLHPSAVNQWLQKTGLISLFIILGFITSLSLSAQQTLELLQTRPALTNNTVVMQQGEMLEISVPATVPGSTYRIQRTWPQDNAYLEVTSTGGQLKVPAFKVNAAGKQVITVSEIGTGTIAQSFMLDAKASLGMKAGDRSLFTENTGGVMYGPMSGEVITAIPALQPNDPNPPKSTICTGGYVYVTVNGATPTHTYRLQQTSPNSTTVYDVIADGTVLNFPGVNPTTYATWTITDRNNTFSTNIVIDVVPQPSAPVLTKSPSSDAVCSGTDVSATIFSNGSDGVAACEDSYQYRTNGGSWSAYNPGDAISTTGLTSVDIRALRSDNTGAGCSSENIYSWTVNALPVPVIHGPTDVCTNSIQTYTTEARMQAYSWIVTGGTGSSSTNSININWGSAGPGQVEVNYTDANGCNAAANSTISVTKTDAPSVSSITLRSTIDNNTWQSVNGDLSSGFNCYVYPCSDYTYLDVSTFTASTDILQDYLHPFHLNQTGLPSGWNAYWAAKGVVQGATGWQGVMYEIINGNQPIFYLKKSGSDYLLIDGLLYQTEQGEQTLRISGDYPLGAYTYDGYLHATAGCYTSLSIGMTFERGILNQTLQLVYGSIQAAIDGSADGNTIEVCDGTYSGNITVNKNISLVSKNGAAATILDGDDSGSHLGTITLTSGRYGVVIGQTDKGFTIKGIDGPPGLEKASVYLQGTQQNITVEGNILEARGDAALMGEYNAVNNNITINNNQITGQTFDGTEPATGDQFTVPNVARQAVVFGGGPNTTNTGNFIFTNNTISTIAGGVLYGNGLVTLDLVGTNIITGNTFGGTTLGTNAALRVRGSGAYAIEANRFVGNYSRALTRVGAPIEATCNWWGTASYETIYSMVGGYAVFVPYLLTDESGAVCAGGPALPDALTLTYTEANEDILVAFDATANELELQPVPGINPSDPNYLALVTDRYNTLAAAIQSGVPAAIQAAALGVGDDIITEYYYMDGPTKVYLETINTNDLVKNKYWDKYLVGPEPANIRYPDWANSITLVPQANYRTHTNPLTGSVAAGWLNPVLGRDLYVTVTFINNGSVNSITESIAIPAGCIVNTTTGLGYPTIQAAIDAPQTLGGHVIELCPGTFNETVTINKSIHLKGQTGQTATTIIAPPATLPVAADPLSSIVIVSGIGVNAEISGLTIQGPGPSGCGSIGRGVFVRDGADAYIHDNNILDIRDNAAPLSGCQNGIAIQVGRQAYSTSGTATIENNLITGYQKGAIVVDNTGSSATITGNTITGIGTTAITAQNGVQISRGATATISRNTISGNSFHLTGNASDWGACGILLYQSGAVALTGGNNISGNDQNYYATGVTGALSLGVEIFGTSAAPVTNGYQIGITDNYNLDATLCTFNGINPATATLTELFAIEDRIWHGVDDPGTGFVMVKSGNVYVTPTEIGAHIQYGIDAAIADDIVHVQNGDYGIETASNRYVFGTNGPHIFGLFIDKANLTVRGYKSGDIPVANASEAAVLFNTGSTANFGPSGVFVEANGVTLEGLKIGDNYVGSSISSNKTIEVIGDAFTMNKCFVNTSSDEGAFYMGRWDATHPIVSYSITNNIFNNSLVSINNGVGITGPKTDRLITGNEFTGIATPYLIGFRGWNGANPAQGWIVDPVGGAVITGNAFNNTGVVNYFIARGNTGGYVNSELDWAEIWNSNTYGNHVVTLTDQPTFAVRYYTDAAGYTETRRISPLIQENVTIGQTNDVVLVSSGTFNEDVLISSGLKLQGQGLTNSTIVGQIGGDGATIRISSPNVIVDGFAITREGNNLTDWNNGGLNAAGIAIQSQGNYAEIRNCSLYGNRTGIDINNSNSNNIHNNLIDNNRTGLIFRNQTDNTILTNNFITNNWTVGVLFLDASSGTNSPVQSALNSQFNNNDISGNWYGDIIDRQAGGSLPLPGTSNMKNFECNWFGTVLPVVSTANSTEPGYPAQIPVIYGGTAVAPGGQPNILGPASANFDYVSYYLSGGDDAGIGFQPTGTCDGTPVDIVTATPDHILCGETTGSIEVVFSGGTANFTVNWGAGSQTGVTGSPFYITGLAAGSYTITVTDTYGSSDVITAEVLYLPVTNTTNNPDTYYATIQDAIDAASDDDVITVCAGTYAETIGIGTKGLTLLGPNAGIDPNGSGTRSTEAVINPTDWYGIYVGAEDVKIDGLTIDGLTTCDYGIYAATTAGQGGLLITNNIVKNLKTYGFLGYVPSGPASSNNSVTKNLFESAGDRAIVALWNYYADVSYNDIKDVVIGIYAENANLPESTGDVEWKNNTISATRAGIWYNLVYGTATPMTISDNTITYEEDAAVTRWDGIWLTSLGGSINPSITGNIITGADPSTKLVSGYHLWHNTTTAADGITIQGGSVTNVDYGIWINNWDGYPTTGGSNAGYTKAKIDGITITEADLAGVYLKDNPLNTSGASAFVYAKLTNSTISGSGTGILVEGDDASSDVIDNPATITGNQFGIVVKDGADLASVTGNTITNNTHGGIIIESTASTIGVINNNTISGNGYTVDATHGLGLKNELSASVDAQNNWWGDASGPYNTPYNTCGTGNAVVGPVDFMPWWTTESGGSSPELLVHNVTKGTWYCKIQDAIDDADANNTIQVSPGTYFEAVSINEFGLTLVSTSGRDVTFIENPNVGSETAGISVLANMGNVTVEGFTVNNFRNGITQGMAAAAGTTFIVKNNKVIPENNSTTPYLRNGIQVSGENSQIIGNYVVGAPLTSTWASTGIGVVNAKGVLVKDNTVNTASADIGIGITNWSAVLVENITIKGNIVNGAKNSIRISGQNQAQAVKGVVIENNQLTNSPSSSGINVQTVSLEDLTITGNTITGHFYAGVRFSGTSATLSGSILINGNTISGNTQYGVYNGTAYSVDATNNWWGDATGPYSNPYNLCGLGNAVSANVNFNPWWKTATGGTGSLAIHNTTQGTFYCRIQNAIDDAAHGDVIEVADGSYTYLTEGSPLPSGLIKVTKGVTIKAATGVRPVIDGSGFDGVFKIHPSALIPGNTVVIEGFEIIGDETTGIAITTQGCYNVIPAKVIIQNNWFHGMVGGIDFWGAGAYLPSGWTSGVVNTEITGNKFYNMVTSGSDQGFGIMIEDPINWVNAGNDYAVKIENNEFSNLPSNGANPGVGIVIPRADGSLEAANVYIAGNSFASSVPVSLAIMDGDVSTALVENNSFDNNPVYAMLVSGIDNGPLAATCNWYGTTTVAGVAAKISGPVTFSPWLTNGFDNSTNIGFQPVPNSCAGATSLYVNDLVSDNGTNDIYTTAIGNDANAGTADAPFLTISHAVSMAVEGTTIYVDAGAFQEQVSIAKTLNIIGVDRTKTIVKAPVSMTPVSVSIWSPSENVYPVIYASGNSNTVNISKLTIDGDNGRTVNKFFGALYYEANGTFDNNRITAIRDAGTFSGAQAGIAFYGGHIRTVTLAQTINVTNNIIDDYQKGGIVVDAPGTSGALTGNTITGQNVALVTAQNGIQLSRGATGTISGNTVTNNIWNKVEHPHEYTAAGILLYQAGTSTVENNILTGNELGLSSSGSVGVTYGVNNFTDNKIHLWLDAALDVNAGNVYDKTVLNPAMPEAVFGCIQYAVDEATAGNTLNASGGTFAEQVFIHTPVDLRGPNYDINPISATRVLPEAIITFPTGLTGSQELISIGQYDSRADVDDVKINGFIIDGSTAATTASTTGIMGNGDDLVVKNNIIKNFNYVSLWISSYVYEGGTWVYDDYINSAIIGNNYIHNADIYSGLQPTDVPYGIYLQGTYGSVTGNKIETVKSGIQVQPYNHPNTTSLIGTVSDNSFEAYRDAMWYNYSENANANWVFDNNSGTGIAPPSAVTENEWRGFRVTTNYKGDLSFTNNVLTPGATNSLDTYGVQFVQPSTADVVVSVENNTISGFDYGVNIPVGIAYVSNIDIENNKITSNSLYGVFNGTSSSLNATQNWWGDASGPYKALGNTCGLGNDVTDNVTICLWYTDAVMTNLDGCETNTSYTVTGGGSYCYGGTGVIVGLNDSETGVEYQLYLDNVPVGATVSGTGEAISFGNQTLAGTYTVKGTKTVTGCTLEMTGSVVVSINSLPTATIEADQTQSVCSSDNALINVNLTGTAPWSLTYTVTTAANPSGTPVTVTSINESPHVIEVNNPVSNTTYTINSVTDYNCSNTSIASAKVYVGPITHAGIIADACEGSVITIPFTVESFEQVGYIALTLDYLPGVLTYIPGSADFNDDLGSGFNVDVNTPGRLKVSGYTPDYVPGVGLDDGDTLFTVDFTYHGGSTPLTWYDPTSDPSKCEYGSGWPDYVEYCDTPIETYYKNGSVSGYPRPTVVVSGTNTICNGQSTDVSFNFTGTAPWNLTYTVNGVEQQVVTTSDDPYILTVNPIANTTYLATALSDANCASWAGDITGSAVVTVNPTPMISFGFNGVEAGHNASFTYCYDQPVGVTLFANYGGTAPFSVTYTLDGGAPVTVGGLYVGSTIVDPQYYDAGNHYVVVTDIVDANGCHATNEFLSYCTATITINALPIVTDVTLQASVGTTPGASSWFVGGTYPSFNMCIDPLVLNPSYYYMDINTLSSTNALQANVLNGFVLNQSNLPANWWTYWSAQGVTSTAASGTWQAAMWPIINGTAPAFYINYTGGDYQMIDGLTYQFGGVQVPLKVPGDYPEFNYTYTGTVQDVNGCISSTFNVNMEFNTVPVPTIIGDAIVCSGSTATYTTESGMNNYQWTVVGGTGSSTSNSITVTWGSGATGSVSVNYTDPDGNCTASSATIKNVTINALPIVTDVTLQASVGTTPGASSWFVGGTYPSFNMCIDPLVLNPSYYYMDINTLSSTNALQANVLNGFVLNQSNLPANWWTYWSAQGVTSTAASGTWQAAMWPIINGTAPAFYINYTGGDYQMIDGLTYQFGGVQVPLKVPGDYPEFNYTYTGTVQDVNGCISSTFNVNMEFNTVPVPTIIGDAIVCSGSTATYTTESGMNNYQWTVVGGTGSSTSSSIVVTWGTGATGSVSVNYTDPDGNCTATSATIKNVTINALPVVGFSFNDNLAGTGSIFNYCYNETVTVTLSEIWSGTAPFDISWTVNDVLSSVTDVELGDELFSSILTAGTYVVEVISIVDANGCSPSDYAPYTATAIVHPQPTATASVTTTIPCNGSTATVTIMPLVGTAPFTFYFGSEIPNTTGVFTGIVAGTYSWSFTDANGCISATGSLEVNEPVAITVSGTVKYHNTNNIAMNEVTVNLLQGGVVVHTTTTSDTGIPPFTPGSYSFANVCPGDYEIVLTTTRPVGGINSGDAAVANSWSVLPFTSIEKVRYWAGDVVRDNPTSQIDATDASRILYYFVTDYNPHFANAPDWTFWKTGEMVTANSANYPSDTVKTLTVSAGSEPITLNFYALVTGDFNRSHNPNATKSLNENLSLNIGGSTLVEPGVEFDLPITTGMAMEVGAVSMILDFPTDQLEVTGVYLGTDPDSPLVYAVVGEELRIGWNALFPMSLNTGDALLTLKLRTIGSMTQGETIRLSLTSDPLNELADGEYNTIPNAQLFVDEIGGTTTGLPEVTINSKLLLESYPNPFVDRTTFAYSLPKDGRVVLEIADMHGSKTDILLDALQSAGNHTLTVDMSNYPVGVYTATLRLYSNHDVISRTIKVIRRR